MPGEFNDLIPAPHRNPRRRFRPTPIERVLARQNERPFDTNDASFAAERTVNADQTRPVVRTPLKQLIDPQVKVDASRPPRSTPAFGAQQEIPEAAVQQRRPMMVDRLFSAIGRGANQAIEAGGPVGFDPETIAMLRKIGLFNRNPSNPTLLGTANEVLIGGGTALADLGLRALAAAGQGGISGFGQVLREAGVSQGGARRAERDLRAALTVLGLASGAAPMSLSQVPTAVRVRRMNSPMFKPFSVRPMLRQPSSDSDFRREIEHVLETAESSVGRVRNPHLGPITIDFGKPGRGRDFRGGFGLIHIIQKRNLRDGIDGSHFVRERLPEVLARGKLKLFDEDPEDPFSRRAVIDLGRDRAVLSLFRGNKKDKTTPKKNWILTGYEKNPNSR